MVIRPMQLAAIVDDRRRDEVVLLERLGGLRRGRAGGEAVEIDHHHVLDERGRIAPHQQMQRDGAADDLARVDREQAIGLVGDLAPRAQLVEHVGDRLRVAHRDDVLGHEPADRALVVVARVGQPRAVLRRQRLRHFLEHVVRRLAREVGEIVGIERAEHVHELVARELLQQRGARLRGGFDERGAGLVGLELPEDQQAIVAGQRIEDRRDVRGMLGCQMALQLDEVLSMLHLLEQVMARGLLPAGERGQHAMAIEQAHDLVAQIRDRLTSGSG